MLCAAVIVMQTIPTVKTTTHVTADVNVYSRTAYNIRAIYTHTHTHTLMLHYVNVHHIGFSDCRLQLNPLII